MAERDDNEPAEIPEGLLEEAVRQTLVGDFPVGMIDVLEAAHA